MAALEDAGKMVKFATAPKGSSTSALYLLNVVRFYVVLLKVCYMCCKVMWNRSDTSFREEAANTV